MTEQLIEEFLEEVKKVRNAHIRVEELHLTAYIRVTCRYINHHKVDTIDVGSVEVDQLYRNSGCCTQFLQCIENIAKRLDRKVYVECVHNEILHNMLRKRGYQMDDLGENYWN